MKSYSFAKALTLGCFVCMLLPIACGDDDDSPPGPSKGGSSGSGGESNGGDGPVDEGGAAGAKPGPLALPGTSNKSETIECNAADCSSTPTLSSMLFINPCCAQGNTCGVDSGFLQVLGTDLGGVCLPKHQPGPKDAACPDSPTQQVTVGVNKVQVKPFAGCCRAATGTCGFTVDVIDTTIGAFTSPMLGCVDSAAFTKTPGAKCGDNAGGGGAGGGDAGAGGAGGMAGPDAGGAGAGGVAQ